MSYAGASCIASIIMKSIRQEFGTYFHKHTEIRTCIEWHVFQTITIYSFQGKEVRGHHHQRILLYCRRVAGSGDSGHISAVAALLHRAAGDEKRKASTRILELLEVVLKLLLISIK